MEVAKADSRVKKLPSDVHSDSSLTFLVLGFPLVLKFCFHLKEREPALWGESGNNNGAHKNTMILVGPDVTPTAYGLL